LREIFRKAGVRRRSQLVRVALTGSSGTATK
jgi:DNA-binding CsgD family transcriptional regulator